MKEFKRTNRFLRYIFSKSKPNLLFKSIKNMIDAVNVSRFSLFFSFYRKMVMTVCKSILVLWTSISPRLQKDRLCVIERIAINHLKTRQI